MKKILKTPVWLFTLCMGVVILFSLLANMVNTSLYSVKVKNVAFETEGTAFGEEYEGQLEGLLYTPKGCDKDNPCPVIVTTHGYLNSKEMQDAPAIELSKRGYIVLALDMYDHGESTWTTPAQFAFYTVSLWDAVKWVYDQPYTLKDANGNGMIAVSGHSMGGFSTEMAVMYDTLAYGTQGHLKIAVSLTVGADYRYTNESIINMYGTRSSGMILAHFDEFFGDDGELGRNTVGYKDYVETEEGQSFLKSAGYTLSENEEFEAGKIYEVNATDGQRVIYTPYEIHPWNHFSTETTGYMIDFYEEAFSYQLEKAGLASEFSADDMGGQTWWLKETFEFIALIGLLVAIVPALAMLLKVPFFAKVRTDDSAIPVEKETSKGKKIGLAVVALVTSLIPAYYFPTFISSGEKLPMFSDLMEDIIYICTVFAVAGWIIYLVSRMFKTEEESVKSREVAWGITKGAIMISFVALFVRYLANNFDILKTGYYYNAPTASSIGFWALISAGIALLTLVIVHYIVRRKDEVTIKSYGLVASFKQVCLAFLISVILFVGLYAIVFLVGWIFNTDFRLWVYAIKSFEWHHFVSFLRYVPVYFVYYFINSIVVTSNTKNVKGWKGYLYALALNIGGLLLFLAWHYGKLFITGTAGVADLSLEPILLFGLIPSLAVAAIFARKFYEKTNNVWTSAFFNTFLFTMIAIANTTVYLLAM